MRRSQLPILIAITACSPSQVTLEEACITLDSAQWDPTDARQELLTKINDAAGIYAALADKTDNEIHADFITLTDTFINFTGYMKNDGSVGYDEIISQVYTETVQQSGRFIAWRKANCPN